MREAWTRFAPTPTYGQSKRANAQSRKRTGPIMSIRPVKRIAQSKPTMEGAGVKLHRAFGFGNTSEFDPFLLFDDFRNDRPDDYLTKERFVTLYDKCGSILHTKNPFASEQDYAKLEEEGPKWYLRIVNLLNAHTIRLVGDVHLYLSSTTLVKRDQVPRRCEPWAARKYYNPP